MIAMSRTVGYNYVKAKMTEVTTIFFQWVLFNNV